MVVSFLVTYTCLICSEKLLKVKCIYNFFACNILLFVFYVLLTMHLGIILVNNQLGAQFSFLKCSLQFSTCFEQHVENCNEHLRKENCASSWLLTRIAPVCVCFFLCVGECVFCKDVL
jgi:hypothetical protein